MSDPEDLLLILTGDDSLTRNLQEILSIFAWRCECVGKIGDLLDKLQYSAPAAILIDSAYIGFEGVVETVRSLPAPVNGTPLLFLGDAPDGGYGAGGTLPIPLNSEQFLEMLREWAGPLDEASLRADPGHPRYRLIRLVGLTNADGMLSRFITALEEAVRTATTEPSKIHVHRLAGIAGMLGFTELGHLWADVEAEGKPALERAVSESRALLAQLTNPGPPAI